MPQIDTSKKWLTTLTTGATITIGALLGATSPATAQEHTPLETPEPQITFPHLPDLPRAPERMVLTCVPNYGCFPTTRGEGFESTFIGHQTCVARNALLGGPFAAIACFLPGVGTVPGGFTIPVPEGEHA